MLRQMGERGLDYLWQAESIMDHLAAVQAQIETQTNGPFLLFREHNGGLVIEAGKINDEIAWRIDSERVSSDVDYTPKLLIGKGVNTDNEVSEQLICDPWCRIVTDEQTPKYLIWDHIGLTDADDNEAGYEYFLKDHLNGMGECRNEFPKGATMLALGGEGVTNLVDEFVRLTEGYYTNTLLGKLEIERIKRKAHEALQSIKETGRGVAFDLSSLRKAYEATLTDELVHMDRETQVRDYDQFYKIIEKWCKNDRPINVSQISRWVAESMHAQQDNSIDYDELRAAVEAELEREVQEAKDNLARTSSEV